MKAFPTTTQTWDIHNGKDLSGMDLRDYFASDAMRALIPLLANNQDIPNGDARRHEVSVLAYKMADAMMEARERK